MFFFLLYFGHRTIPCQHYRVINTWLTIKIKKVTLFAAKLKLRGPGTEHWPLCAVNCVSVSLSLCMMMIINDDVRWKTNVNESLRLSVILLGAQLPVTVRCKLSYRLDKVWRFLIGWLSKLYSLRCNSNCIGWTLRFNSTTISLSLLGLVNFSNMGKILWVFATQWECWQPSGYILPKTHSCIFLEEERLPSAIALVLVLLVRLLSVPSWPCVHSHRFVLLLVFTFTAFIVIDIYKCFPSRLLLVFTPLVCTFRIIRFNDACIFDVVIYFSLTPFLYLFPASDSFFVVIKNDGIYQQCIRNDEQLTPS